MKSTHNIQSHSTTLCLATFVIVVLLSQVGRNTCVAQSPRATTAPAVTPTPAEPSKPIAIFIQTDPWAMVIGADAPRVAVYDNGVVIFRKIVNKRGVYHRAMLDEKALAPFRRSVKDVLALKSLKSYIDLAPNVTDLPDAKFYMRDGEHVAVTTVYGLMAEGTELPAYTVGPNEGKPDVAPAELLKLHKTLCEFDDARATPWTPTRIEVMFWDYSYAPDASIKWPAEWPSLSSDKATKRGDDYSIFLDGDMLPKVQAFLATRHEKGAVEIDGKKMAASYRFVFPDEPVWKAAFKKAAEKSTATGK